MKCLICNFTSEIDEINANSKSNKSFIHCLQCNEALYCSKECADLGWFGHRFLCEISKNKINKINFLTKEKENMEDELGKYLRRFIIDRNLIPSYEEILYLLEKISLENDNFSCLKNEVMIPLINNFMDIIKLKIKKTTNVIELTSIILLGVKLLSIILKNHDEALNWLRWGISYIIKNKKNKDCILILESEKMNIWTRKYSKVIISSTNSPISSQKIISGESIAYDNIPLLVWEANGFPSALSSRESSFYDEGLKNLRDAYINKKSLISKNNNLIKDNEINIMNILLNELPCIKEINSNVIMSAISYLKHISDNSILPQWLIQLYFTSMISKRKFKIIKWGIFDLASRIKHSCAPNSFWNSETGEIKALRTINSHEIITMDIFWGSITDNLHQTMLKLPIYLRQESIQTNIGILCKCDRCMGKNMYSHYISNLNNKKYHIHHQEHLKNNEEEQEGKEEEKEGKKKYINIKNVDPLRAFPCLLCRKEEGWQYREISNNKEDQQESNVKIKELNQLLLQKNFTPYEPWICFHCGERWRDSEIPIEKETKLIRTAERLVMMATRGIIRKGFFEEVKTLMQDILQLMGRQHHSAYLLACEVFIYFYRYISNKFNPPTSLIAQNYILSWCRKWIKCAFNIQLEKDCPHIYASFIFSVALSLSNSSLLRDKVILLRHAELFCSVSVIFGSNSLQTKAVNAILYDKLNSEYSTMGQAPSAFIESINKEEQDSEDALIREWESHLLHRLQSEIQSSEKPNIPQHILKVLDEKTSFH